MSAPPVEKASDQYRTPLELYEWLDRRFRFELGPAFMNPPYSSVGPWVAKAESEANSGCLVVGLVRHDTSTKWWAAHVRGKALVIEPPYRVHFREVGSQKSAGAYNFPSAIVIWSGDLGATRPGGAAWHT